MTDVHVVDTTMRDGANSFSHQFTTSQVSAIAAGLDQSGVKLIEVTHGDGLGGSSLQLGRAAHSDAEYITAAVQAVKDARIAVLYVPGIATLNDLAVAQECGAQAVRIAVHCTEADCAEQSVRWARERGLEVLCFLMMSHMVEPAVLAEQAALLDSYGAQVVYTVDSAGALTPSGAAARVRAMRDRVSCEVGFHAHNNLGLAVGNTLAAIDAGATYVDGSLCGLGASAGNAATEVLVAAMEREGHKTGVDLFDLVDVAEDIVSPLMPRPQVIDATALTIGYAGVYSTFFLFAKRAAEKYGVSSREILLELGHRGVIGGQEDMIVDVAAELARNAGVPVSA
ncbi:MULTISPECIES: 4-hydroxy-2-oxovalerate aldolase [Rhodococcus]|uniref:4-hydroxy-2-oxovalerate aldolase n=1 Tax=Rhodococcus opacus TaxID=37919 RepID=A0A2S8IHF6_RHOOP|nr:MULTISPECIES: 4-hydroxy-2-oxovalerate aldolase [Rhodococcus]MDI9979959.1 4-hydroxy-2-oxovalerate aldolase [Rhodococcus sp. IEGM 1307]PQP14216.1 4-hydroxy-2-oxovalerate aldolase [Rhodococcus opacus]